MDQCAQAGTTVGDALFTSSTVSSSCPTPPLPPLHVRTDSAKGSGIVSKRQRWSPDKLPRVIHEQHSSSHHCSSAAHDQLTNTSFNTSSSAGLMQSHASKAEAGTAGTSRSRSGGLSAKSLGAGQGLLLQGSRAGKPHGPCMHSAVSTSGSTAMEVHAHGTSATQADHHAQGQHDAKPNASGSDKCSRSGTGPSRGRDDAAMGASSNRCSNAPNTSNGSGSGAATTSHAHVPGPSPRPSSYSAPTIAWTRRASGGGNSNSPVTVQPAAVSGSRSRSSAPDAAVATTITMQAAAERAGKPRYSTPGTASGRDSHTTPPQAGGHMPPGTSRTVPKARPSQSNLSSAIHRSEVARDVLKRWSSAHRPHRDTRSTSEPQVAISRSASAQPLPRAASISDPGIAAGPRGPSPAARATYGRHAKPNARQAPSSTSTPATHTTRTTPVTPTAALSRNLLAAHDARQTSNPSKPSPSGTSPPLHHPSMPTGKPPMGTGLAGQAQRPQHPTAAPGTNPRIPAPEPSLAPTASGPGRPSQAAATRPPHPDHQRPSNQAPQASSHTRSGPSASQSRAKQLEQENKYLYEHCHSQQDQVRMLERKIKSLKRQLAEQQRKRSSSPTSPRPFHHFLAIEDDAVSVEAVEVEDGPDMMHTIRSIRGSASKAAVAALEAAAEAKQRSVEELQQRNVELKSTVEQLQMDLKDLERIQRAQQWLAFRKERPDAASKHDKEVIKQLQQHNHDLVAQLETAKKVLDQRTQNLEIYQIETTGHCQRNCELEVQVTELRAQLQRLRTRQLSQDQMQHQQQPQQQLPKANGTGKGWTLASLWPRRRANQEAANQQQKEKEQQQQQEEQREQQERERQQLQQQLRQQQEQVVQLQQELQAKHQQLEQRQAQLVQLQEQQLQHQQEQLQTQLLRQQLTDLQQEQEQLQKEVTRLARLAAHYQDVNMLQTHKLSHLQAQLSRSRAVSQPSTSSLAPKEQGDNENSSIDKRQVLDRDLPTHGKLGLHHGQDMEQEREQGQRQQRQQGRGQHRQNQALRHTETPRHPALQQSLDTGLLATIQSTSTWDHDASCEDFGTQASPHQKGSAPISPHQEPLHTPMQPDPSDAASPSTAEVEAQHAGKTKTAVDREASPQDHQPMVAAAAMHKGTPCHASVRDVPTPETFEVPRHNISADSSVYHTPVRPPSPFPTGLRRPPTALHHNSNPARHTVEATLIPSSAGHTPLCPRPPLVPLPPSPSGALHSEASVGGEVQAQHQTPDQPHSLTAASAGLPQIVACMEEVKGSGQSMGSRVLGMAGRWRRSFFNCSYDA